MLTHWMKTVGEPESDWLLCWVLSLSQSDAGSPTKSIVTPLQAHSTSHTTSLASPFFYSNNHSTNKVLKSKVEKIDKEVAKKNVSHLHHKYYLEEKLLVNEICLKHGKSHEEKAAADLEFDSQELHEMLNDVRLNKFRT